jgi:hypothetical protein
VRRASLDGADQAGRSESGKHLAIRPAMLEVGFTVAIVQGAREMKNVANSSLDRRAIFF